VEDRNRETVEFFTFKILSIKLDNPEIRLLKKGPAAVVMLLMLVVQNFASVFVKG
jgi:hypothetical protein